MDNINVKTWDTVYSEGRSLLIWPDETVVSSLNKHKGKFNKGIDLACGAGRHTILMAQMGIESTGVDSSKSSIEFAKKRAAELGLTNIKFINGLVQEIEFEKESFDLVIAWGLIHYLEPEDQKQFLDKVWAILKSGGLFLCTLRSNKDSRMEFGEKTEENRYLIDYFDSGTDKAKQTALSFWDEDGVRELLRKFSSINLGHRIKEPIGKLNCRTAHWLVEAYK